MTKAEVIAHFGSSIAVAKVLNGISPAGVRHWPEKVPRGRQFEIERLTDGALKVDPDLLGTASQDEAA